MTGSLWSWVKRKAWLFHHVVSEKKLAEYNYENAWIPRHWGPMHLDFHGHTFYGTWSEKHHCWLHSEYNFPLMLKFTGSIPINGPYKDRAKFKEDYDVHNT